VGDITNIRCTAIVMLQLCRLLRGEDLGVLAERVGAVDSCVVLRAGLVLTRRKEKEERKK